MPDQEFQVSRAVLIERAAAHRLAAKTVAVGIIFGALGGAIIGFGAGILFVLWW